MDYDNLTYDEAKSMLKQAEGGWLDKLRELYSGASGKVGDLMNTTAETGGDWMEALKANYKANPFPYHVGGGAALGAGLGGLSSLYQPKKRRNTLGRMLTGGLLGGLGGAGAHAMLNTEGASQSVADSNAAEAGRQEEFNELKQKMQNAITAGEAGNRSSTENATDIGHSIYDSIFGEGEDGNSALERATTQMKAEPGLGDYAELIEAPTESIGQTIQDLTGQGDQPGVDYTVPFAGTDVELPSNFENYAPTAAGATAGLGYLGATRNRVPRTGGQGLFDDVHGALQGGTNAQQSAADEMLNQLNVERQKPVFGGRLGMGNIANRLKHGNPFRRVLSGRGVQGQPFWGSGQRPAWAGAVRQRTHGGLKNKLKRGGKATALGAAVDYGVRNLLDQQSGMPEQRLRQVQLDAELAALREAMEQQQ